MSTKNLSKRAGRLVAQKNPHSLRDPEASEPLRDQLVAQLEEAISKAEANGQWEPQKQHLLDIWLQLAVDPKDLPIARERAAHYLTWFSFR